MLDVKVKKAKVYLLWVKSPRMQHYEAVAWSHYEDKLIAFFDEMGSEKDDYYIETKYYTGLGLRVITASLRELNK